MAAVVFDEDAQSLRNKKEGGIAWWFAPLFLSLQEKLNIKF